MAKRKQLEAYLYVLIPFYHSMFKSNLNHLHLGGLKSTKFLFCPSEDHNEGVITLLRV